MAVVSCRHVVHRGRRRGHRNNERPSSHEAVAGPLLVLRQDCLFIYSQTTPVLLVLYVFLNSLI